MEKLVIDRVEDLVTNVDPTDLGENFASDLRGFRIDKDGVIVFRDYGTIHRFASYPSGFTFVYGATIYIPSENTQYELAVGYDSSNNTQIYVDDGAGGWTQLTRTVTGVITAISSTLVTFTTSDTFSANDLVDYIATIDDASSSTAGLITANAASGAATITLVNKADSTLGWGVGQMLKIYRFTGLLPDRVLGSGRGFQPSNGTTPHVRFLQLQAQNKATMFYGNSSTPITPRQPLMIRRGKHTSPSSFTIGGTSTGWVYKTSLSASATCTSIAIATKSITGATNASPIEITVVGHGLSTGNSVFIRDVAGNTAANGTWSITKTGTDTFTLDTSTGNGGYTSGGKIEWAYVGLSDGHIYRSTNAGTSWTDISPVISSGIQKIRALDSTTVLACGVAIGTAVQLVKSTNANAASPSWSSITSGITLGTNLYDISIIDANNMYVAGNNGVNPKVFKTTNGGTTWTDATGTLPTGFVRGISFTSATTGWAIVNTFGVDRAVYRTTNSGTTWTRMTSPTSGVGGFTNTPFAIQMVSSSIGWVACDTGELRKTTDGGVNWSTESTPDTYGLYDLSFVSTTVGRVGTDRGGAISTTDGSTWIQDYFPPSSQHIRGIAVFDSLNAYAVGTAGSIYRLSGSSSTSTAGGTSATGWYIDKEGLLPDFVRFGTLTLPKINTDAAETKVVGEGIRIKCTYQQESDPTHQKEVRVFITALYVGVDGLIPYQESDPICQICLSPNGNGVFPSAQVQVSVDMAKVNKTLYGFRFYHNQVEPADISNNLANWLDDAGEYLQVYELLYSTAGWSLDTTDQYSYSNTMNSLTLGLVSEALAAAPSSLLANVGHAVDLTRSYITPRFGVRTARGQKAVNVVDQNDLFLRTSSYDGAGGHEDDNYPDVETDNSGRTMKVQLNGKGSVRGLAKLGPRVLVFREEELEIFMFDNNGSLISDGIVRTDFWAKDSLTGIGVNDNVMGVAWAGNYGLYYMGADGGARQILNKNQLNFYNGDLYCSDNQTPYVSATFRQAVRSGFVPATNEIVFQVQANKFDLSGTEYLLFMYNIDTGKCRTRKASQQVMYFTNRLDGTITFGISGGLLQYPNKAFTSASTAYQEEVPSTGASAGSGIDSRVRINVGGLYSLNPRAVFKTLQADYVGRASSNNLFYVNLYVNGQTTAFDSLGFRMNERSGARRIKPIGQVKRLEVEVQFPSTALAEFKEFELRNITLGYDMLEKEGNV